MSTKKNILFISQYFPPDITAAAFRVSETASILKKKGFEVKILTAFPHKVNLEDNLAQEEFEVIRVPVLRLSQRGKKAYIMHYLSFMLSSLLLSIFKIRSPIDYVIVTSPPLPVAISGWILARVKKARFILDIRDIWPESLIDTGHIKKSSVLYKIAKFFEHTIYYKAEMITCVSKKMKEYISFYTGKNTPVVILYNGLSKRFLEENKICNGIGYMHKEYFTVTYIGNFGYAQNLDLLIEEAKKIENTDIRFVLVGEGALKKNLVRRVREEEIKNVIFKEACKRKDAFSYMLDSDALIVILNKSSSVFMAAIPSKVFDYLWANKPILYNIEGECREILGSLAGNLYFNSSQPGALRETINKLRGNYKFYEKEAKKNRDFVLENFSREKSVDELEKYLKEDLL